MKTWRVCRKFIWEYYINNRPLTQEKQTRQRCSKGGEAFLQITALQHGVNCVNTGLHQVRVNIQIWAEFSLGVTSNIVNANHENVRAELTLWSAEDKTWGGSGWGACPGTWVRVARWDSWGSSSGRWRRAQWPLLPASCRQTWPAAPETACSRLTRGRSWLLWSTKTGDHTFFSDVLCDTYISTNIFIFQYLQTSGIINKTLVFRSWCMWSSEISSAVKLT